jgi:DNA polymerase III epsilon subunit-like protein
MTELDRNSKAKNLFLFYDTETTSSEPTVDAIISIGAVLADYSEGKFCKLGDFHSYISATRPIDPAAEAVHHISASDIAEAPNFCEVMDLFKCWVQTQTKQFESMRLTLMAHNGSKFDDLILFCNFVSNALNFDQFLADIRVHGFVDTLKFIRQLFKGKPDADQPKRPDTGRKSFALGNCYSSFCGGNSLEGAHDALVDSQALFDIFTSDCVRPMFDIFSLFKFVVSKEKALDAIKRSAGVAFQQMEERARQQAIDDNIIAEGGMPDIPNQAVACDPIWDKSSDDSVRLCLCCMQFVSMSEHAECTLPVSTLQ